MSFYYLASVYSNYSKGIICAHEEACQEAALLMRHGIVVFSPIAHSHSIAIHGDLDPFDHSLWLDADKKFMNAAKGLIVCMMEGWEFSEGIKAEIQYFSDANQPVIYMTPGIVPGELSHE